MKRLALLIVALAFTATASSAGTRGLGPQGGFSLNPDQFVLGLHLIAPIADRVDLVPSVDVGFGDEVTTIALNGDIRIGIAPEKSLKPYAGVGITWYDVDPTEAAVESFSEVGASLLGGVWLNADGGTSYYVEGRIGLGDVPDFKAMFGVNF